MSAAVGDLRANEKVKRPLQGADQCAKAAACSPVSVFSFVFFVVVVITVKSAQERPKEKIKVEYATVGHLTGLIATDSHSSMVIYIHIHIYMRF